MNLRALEELVFGRAASTEGLSRYRVEHELQRALNHYCVKHPRIPEAPPYGPMMTEAIAWASGTSKDPTTDLTYYRGEIAFITSAGEDYRWEPEEYRDIEERRQSTATSRAYKRTGFVYALRGRTIEIVTALTDETVTITHYMLPPCQDFLEEADEEVAYPAWGHDLTAEPLFPLQFHEMLALRALTFLRPADWEKMGRKRLTDLDKKLDEELAEYEKDFKTYLNRQQGKIWPVQSLGKAGQFYKLAGDRIAR